MSQENVEVVRRMYEAFHSGDAERALAHFAPDVVVDATMRVDAGIGHGREELNAIVGRWVGAEVHGSQITRMTMYPGPAEALAAVGLRG
jgi:hypothetical protein